MANKTLAELPVCTTPAPGNWLLIETPAAAQKLDAAWLTSPTGGGQTLANHIALAADAHDATAVSFAPAGSVAATNVQAAIEEVATEGNNTANTKAALVGASDIEITDAAKGIILRSPNGSRWRLTVDNAGALVVAAA
jgi:hypothetical protein